MIKTLGFTWKKILKHSENEEQTLSLSALSYLLKNTNTSLLEHPVISNMNAGPKEIRVKRFLL